MIDWLFRSRRTRKIAIVQVPNAPLVAFFVASVLRRVVDASGMFNVVLTATTTGALVVWAGAELIRGVNPWRRVLGGGVLAWQILNLALG